MEGLNKYENTNMNVATIKELDTLSSEINKLMVDISEVLNRSLPIVPSFEEIDINPRAPSIYISLLLNEYREASQKSYSVISIRISLKNSIMKIIKSLPQAFLKKKEEEFYMIFNDLRELEQKLDKKKYDIEVIINGLRTIQSNTTKLMGLANS